MQKGSTLLLRAAVCTMGVIVLALCLTVAPAIFREWGNEYPHLAYFRYPIVAGIGIAAIAFFAALFQTLKLLTYIDKEDAFSSHSVRALRKIKRCALLVSLSFAAELPAFYQVAQNDDAPGLILIGLFFVGAPLVISVFAAVIERVLRSAIAIKKENDLTV